MKKIILILLASLLGYALLYFSLSFVVSNLSKWEVKGFLTRTLTKEKVPLSIFEMPMSEGIKYVPEKTHRHLIEGDDVYSHFVYERNSQGKPIRNKCYNIGPSNSIITTDEYLKYYLAYEYNKEGKLSAEVCYEGKGADNKWFTQDDLESYNSVYEYDGNGNKLRAVRHKKDGSIVQYTTFEASPKGLIIKDLIYKGKGADNKWFSADDEIEKYHRFEYDNKEYLVRIAEYHAERNGQGKVGVWFSPDDMISATKSFSYCDDGYMTKIKKCIGAGIDNLWFTDDDVVQYYTVYNYTKHTHKAKKGT
ncbi:MAG: hypothetical protein WCL25_05080 [bacterium]